MPSDVRAKKTLGRPPRTDDALEAERLLWFRLVSRFLEHGDTMADAMAAARRVVAFTRGERPNQDVERDAAAPTSDSETLPPPSSRFVPEPERRRR